MKISSAATQLPPAYQWEAPGLGNCMLQPLVPATWNTLPWDCDKESDSKEDYFTLECSTVHLKAYPLTWEGSGEIKPP